MHDSHPRARRRPVARLATRLYAYAFLGDLVLLYPLYALLFADTGLSTAQISSLFVIWSLSGIVLEIPSGVLADVVSRRVLLTVGPVLTAAAFGLWTVAPSYPVFAAGFVLWGAQGALRSGALEALVYEELDRHGAATRYATVIGRSHAASTVAVALAMAAAVPAFAAGGYAAVGAASVAACLASAAVGATFPEARNRSSESTAQDEPSVLRRGLAEVRTDRRVRRAVLFVIAVSAVWGALDEYVPLLAAGTGVATERVPLLVLVVYVGVAVGGLLGGVGRRLPASAVAWLLGVAAVALAAGAVVGHPLGFVAIGIAFCVFQMTEIAAGARLQESMTGSARATVTSVAGLGAEVATIGVFVVYGAASTGAGHQTVFAAWAAVYLLLAGALLRRGWVLNRARRRAAPAPTAAWPRS